MTCVFCSIVDKSAPATVVREWAEAIAIVPLNPVVHGHVLVMPKSHVRDAPSAPYTTADTMRCAAELGASMGPHNVIINVGEDAGQTVFHLHIHLVPRKSGDGLRMPWDKL